VFNQDADDPDKSVQMAGWLRMYILLPLLGSLFSAEDRTKKKRKEKEKKRPDYAFRCHVYENPCITLGVQRTM